MSGESKQTKGEDQVFYFAFEWADEDDEESQHMWNMQSDPDGADVKLVFREADNGWRFRMCGRMKGKIGPIQESPEAALAYLRETYEHWPPEEE